MNKLGLLFLLALVPFGQAKVWGQECNASVADDCLSGVTTTEWLVCKDSRCVCADVMVHHDTLGKCVSPQNGTCTIRNNDGMPWKPCTDYSQCFPPNADDPAKPRLEGTCHCDLDAVYDPVSRKCKLTHGSTQCKAVTDCDVNALLTCQEGTDGKKRCECRYGDRQIYDKDTRECQSYLDESCNEDQVPFKNSNCYTKGHMKCGTNKTCVCEDGFSPAGDVCAKGFNATCNHEAPNDCADGYVCTKEGNENNYYCRCPANQEHFDEDGGKCRINADSECTTAEGDPECTIHATCTGGKCECNSGFTSGNGRCFGTHETPCGDTDNTICHADDYLECKGVGGNENNKTCQCKDKYNWDQTDNVCKGQLQEPCREDVHCAGNTVCKDNKCDCNIGYTFENTTCKGVYDTGCANDGECSIGKFLICNADSKKCDCKNPDNNFRAGDSNDFCSAKAGRACRGENPDCVPNNATCNTANVCGCAENNEANMDGWCVPRTGGDDGAGSLVASSLLIALVLLVNKL